MIRLWMIALGAVLVLSGCAGVSVWATDEEVSRAIYRHDGPTRLTLYTMLNNRTGAGAHTSLLINGSQRLIFDPAGSFKHESIPERNDVLFGATPAFVDIYTRYHARKTYRVRIQTLDVSPELAERAIAAVKAYGAVPAGQCAKSTSSIMAELFPGQISTTWLPRKLAAQFGSIPGVTTEDMYEYDDDDNSKVLATWDPTRAAPQPY